MPSVSVIVPVRNESRSIEKTLRSLLTQDYPSDQFEVIVADGFSTDTTVSIVRQLQGEFSNLRLVYNPKRFSSAARNAAIRHMRGDFAVVIDGHCHIPDRGYLGNLVEAFTSSEADSLGRPQPLDVPEPSDFQAAVSIARSSKLGHNPDSDIYSNEAKFVEPQNTAIAYRRSVFHRIGFFDERFDACEDVEFNHRVYEANLTCYFTPKLSIVYHPRTELRGLFKQLSRYGCGRARLARKHLRSLTLPSVGAARMDRLALGGSTVGAAVPSRRLGLRRKHSLLLKRCHGDVIALGQTPTVEHRSPHSGHFPRHSRGLRLRLPPRSGTSIVAPTAMTMASLRHGEGD